MSKRVSALLAFAGGAAAMGGLIRNARLNEAREDARDARKAVEKANADFDDFIATGSTDTAKGFKLQAVLGDAQAELNEAQRAVDSIQSEEALWAAGTGAAIAAEGLGFGGGGGGGGGDGGGDEGDAGGDMNASWNALTAGVTGFGAGMLGAELSLSSRRRDRDL